MIGKTNFRLIKMQNDFSKLTNAQARKTCLVVAGVLLLIAALMIYREKLQLSAIFGGCALFLVIIGYLIPAGAKVFHKIWMTIAFALGYVNSRILLTLIFFLVFVPYGLVSRLAGRDPLRRRGKKSESYWIPKKVTRQTREGFERLF
jgi:hypothetical protein